MWHGGFRTQTYVSVYVCVLTCIFTCVSPHNFWKKCRRNIKKKKNVLHLGNRKEGQEEDFTFRLMYPRTTSPFYCHCCYSCCHKGNLSLYRELKAPHRSQTEAYWEPRSPSQPLSIAATVPNQILLASCSLWKSAAALENGNRMGCPVLTQDQNPWDGGSIKLWVSFGFYFSL